MRIFALLALAIPAFAAPPDVDPADFAAEPVDAAGAWRPLLPWYADELDPVAAHELLEAAAAYAPDHAIAVRPRVWTDTGVVDLERLFPAASPVPDKEDIRPWFSRPLDLPGAWPGALGGKAVYLSQCHGWIYYESLGRFSTQRGNVHDTVEDFHNPEGANQFLAAYLENAGAGVFTARERDHQPRSVIVDQGDPGYTETGSGFVAGAPGWGRKASWSFGQNPFTTGGTRKFPASGGAVAVWKPQIPAEGSYAVYVSWDSDPEHATDAHYRITHPGGVLDRRFDQTVHGSTWQYVDRLWLTQGESITIELLGDSAQSGRYLSADAVRIGGGTSGDVTRYGTSIRRPRWEEGAVGYTQYNGAPPSVYDPYGDGTNGSDPPARSRWADWEHPRGEDAVYLSWHSNATADGSARGTVTYIYEGSAGAPVAGSEDFAWTTQEELVEAFQGLWEPGWRDRGVKSAAFAEVHPGHNDEMPAILVELAFHDNETDAAFLKHPRFRLDSARAMYRGIVRYFAERDGKTPAYLPEPPTYVAMTHARDGRLTLSWRPGESGAPFGDPATGYVVQTSPDGRRWDTGVPVTGTSTVLDVAPGAFLFARVIATNPGGRSFPSAVVGGLRSHDGEPAVLVVDAFDRFETGQLDWEDPGAGLGPIRRMLTDRVNPYETALTPGLAISEVGWPFDTVTDDALADLDLSRYRLIIWSAAEESTVDDTFSEAQQAALRAYWSEGGALWAHGAEILWDLDAKGSTADKSFASQVLGATLANDDAGTDQAAGVGILDGLDLSFGALTAPYPVEWPDVLQTSRPVVARYATGGTAGALGERVALFGYPFEAIPDPATRAEVVRRILPALVPDYTPPGPSDDTDSPDTDSLDTDESPLAEGPNRTRIRAGCGCAARPEAGGAPYLILAAMVIWTRRRILPGTPSTLR
jgi:hypothetical protein